MAIAAQPRRVAARAGVRAATGGVTSGVTAEGSGSVKTQSALASWLGLVISSLLAAHLTIADAPSPIAPRDIAKAYYDAIAKGKLEAAQELAAPDAEGRAYVAASIKVRKSVSDLVAACRAKFPDAAHELEEADLPDFNDDRPVRLLLAPEERNGERMVFRDFLGVVAELQLVDGHWRVVPRSRDNPHMPLSRGAKYLASVASALDTVREDLDSGRLKTFDAVRRRAGLRVAALAIELFATPATKPATRPADRPEAD